MTNTAGQDSFTMLTPQERQLLPTDADVARYQASGYWVSPPLYSDEELEDARFGCDCYWAGHRHFNLNDQLRPFEGWSRADGDVLRINDYVSLANREVAALVRKPILGAIAARLSASPTIRLWHDQLIYKPPAAAAGTTGIGWHTDKAYWQMCTSEQMLTAWIPLTDCDEEIGTLMVIEGSHRWPVADLRGFHEQSIEASERVLGAGMSVARPVPLVLEAGQVSFHHCRAIHGSGPNRGARPRMSISVHMQDGDNCHRRVMNDEGELVWHRNDALCRQKDGAPDYTDEDICPVLWEEPAHAAR